MALERVGSHALSASDRRLRPFGGSVSCRRLPTAPLPSGASRPPPPVSGPSARSADERRSVEHVADLFRHDLAHDLGHALAEGDPASLGIALRWIALFVIRRHVLGPVARQGTGEPVPIGKIVAAIMQVHAVAVPRQGDIAAMGVHAGRRQHMGAVHRHALRLVDGRGIAVVDPVVVLEVEAHGSTIVGLHGHGLRADLLDGPERAVLHAKATFVLQEHDAVPAGEVSRAAFDRETHLIAQIAGGPHPLARHLVECAYLVVRVREDDPAALWRCLPVAVPAVDQIVARFSRVCGLMHHAMGVDRHRAQCRFCRSPDRALRRAASPPADGAPRRFPRRHDAHGSSGTPRPPRWIATA